MYILESAHILDKFPKLENGGLNSYGLFFITVSIGILKLSNHLLKVMQELQSFITLMT